MLKPLLITAIVAALAAGMGYADQSSSKVILQVSKTAPSNGQQMYVGYCTP
jgi:hypothetical protein